ncbi:DUF2799 domain-containing protein [Vibrio apostichopi]|uniref:DUF2799 domain-containing protein n=1 Tax=Vibrio apostichopi TaxID=3035453 RepID=UPI0025736EB8|nr:DUF2799 domain-containing protein [Vibrio sp. FE10]
MKRFFYVALLSFGLSACSSSPQTASEFWYGQGERFGANGHVVDNDALVDIKKKVPFDESSYQEGYAKGKLEYCDPFRAFEKGIQGTRYDGQCIGMPQEVMTKAEWQRGWDAFIGADFYRVR